MRVVVVGAGVFGLWTAASLRDEGAEVTVVDAYGPANSRSSSGDESRILRYGYGNDALYSRMARRSMEAWAALEFRTRPLWYRCGVLWLSSGDDPYVNATGATLQAEGLPIRELDQRELREGFPHIAAPDVPYAVLETASGAVLARQALVALARENEARGIPAVLQRAIPPDTDGPISRLRLADGNALEADVFVFACGPWLPALFPELLRDRIRPTRQVVVYFGAPDAELFGPRHTPAWIDFASGIYGIPDLEGRGVKVGVDAHGPLFDPDRGERVADQGSIDMARAWLERRFPAMVGAPVLETRVCQYENTSTGDFLIDRHPAQENVWIVGGGSGHGFKHGPAVGAYVAGLITGAAAVEPRFALAAKGTEPARRVF